MMETFEQNLDKIDSINGGWRYGIEFIDDAAENTSLFTKDNYGVKDNHTMLRVLHKRYDLINLLDYSRHDLHLFIETDHSGRVHVGSGGVKKMMDLFLENVVPVPYFMDGEEYANISKNWHLLANYFTDCLAFETGIKHRLARITARVFDMDGIETSEYTDYVLSVDDTGSKPKKEWVKSESRPKNLLKTELTCVAETIADFCREQTLAIKDLKEDVQFNLGAYSRIEIEGTTLSVAYSFQKSQFEALKEVRGKTNFAATIQFCISMCDEHAVVASSARNYLEREL